MSLFGSVGKIVSDATDALGLTDSSAPGEFMGQANAMNAKTRRLLENLDIPDIEKQRIALEMPELVGLLEAEEISNSEIVEDQRLRQDQMRALDALRQRSEEGMTAEDKLQQEQLLSEVGAQERSQRAAIEQEMARKGMGTSGANLMAKLQSSQNLSNQGRQKAMQNAAQSQANRMAATQNLATAAGNVRGQDFRIAESEKSAQNVIDRANAANRLDVAKMNLGLRQDIANQRANLANQQQMYNKGLYQQQYQNQLAKINPQMAMNTNQANMAMQQAQNAANQNASVMSGLFSMGGKALGGWLSDKDAKEDIKEGSSEINELLDKLKPYSYNYKDEYKEDEGDEGRQLGVMAQDLEKSDLGQEFVEEDEEDLKRVDYGKMASTQLAALADLHARLKKLEGKE